MTRAETGNYFFFGLRAIHRNLEHLVIPTMSHEHRLDVATPDSFLASPVANEDIHLLVLGYGIV